MDKVLIYTVVDSKYEDFIPLFVESCKYSYPEYDVQVAARGPYEGYKGYIVENAYLDYPHNTATTAALRFASTPKDAEKYDYVYITDIDMVLLREDKLFHEVHAQIMAKHGYIYENFGVAVQNHGFRMPGVHFVGRDWWGITKEQREHYLSELRVPSSACYREYDECMLYRIVVDSGLKFVAKGHEDWRWHGVHLGKYLKHGNRNAVKVVNGGMERARLRQFINDKYLFNQALMIAERSPDMKLILAKICQLMSDK